MDFAWGAQYRTFWRLGDIVTITPAQAFTFIDEREDSIGDSRLIVNVGERGASAKLYEYPGSYHNGAANLAFADGHAELKRWLDPRTKPKLRRGTMLPFDVPSPNNPDVAWLQERTTAKVN